MPNPHQGLACLLWFNLKAYGVEFARCVTGAALVVRAACQTLSGSSMLAVAQTKPYGVRPARRAH